MIVVEILKSQGVDICVAFSGKEYDYRSPDYTIELKEYVINNNLSANIKFLGFIDRADQLKLLEICRAIIQPSLFEGWSTVIEEAMAFNKLILAADLNVNKEQLGQKGVYFDRYNPTSLVGMIHKINEFPMFIDYNYKTKQLKCAMDFFNCVTLKLKK